MATIGWRTGITVKQALQIQPQAYNFYQAIRLLEQFSSGNNEDERGLDDVVHFRGELGEEYPVETISQIKIENNGISNVDVTDYCIAGVKGPLPQAHSNWVYRNKRHGKGVLSRFLDLFNQRFVSMRYEIKKHFNLTLFNEKPQQNSFYRKLSASTGLKTSGFISQIPATEEILLQFGGLLVDFRHSISKAQTLFHAMLRVPVKFRSFCGEWRDIPPEYHSNLKQGDNCILGRTAVLGTRVWRQDAAMGVIIGPLPYAQYFAIQPGKKYFEIIRGILAYLFDRRFNAHLKLLIREKDVPASVMHSRGRLELPDGSTGRDLITDRGPAEHTGGEIYPLFLGRNSWLKSRSSHTGDGDIPVNTGKKPEAVLAKDYHMDLLNYGL